MIKQNVTTLHIRDAVSKTFHISKDEIILHVDINETPIIVPEHYRPVLLAMVEVAEKTADAIIIMKDIDVAGFTEASGTELGDSAQRIWGELIAVR